MEYATTSRNRKTLQAPTVWSAAKLPSWFQERFPSRNIVASDSLKSRPIRCFMLDLENRLDGARVSALERGVLEMLSEVGVRQPLQEARELMESTYNLRADVLSELLKRCTSVKTVRLCLELGREFSLPWVKKLNPAKLPTGSKRLWVSRPVMACWYSSRESDLSRYSQTAHAGGPTSIR